MKNLKSIEPLVEYIENYDISDSLFLIHDEMIYNMNPDQFDERIQTALYTIKRTAELIRDVENEFRLPTPADEIKMLKDRIKELESKSKSNG